MTPDLREKLKSGKETIEPHANPLYYQRDYKTRENFTATLYLQWHTYA